MTTTVELTFPKRIKTKEPRMMESKETIDFENQYGIITNKRVVLKGKAGYQSIPLEKVNAVSFNKRRNIVAMALLGILPIGTVALMVKGGQSGQFHVGPTELMILFVPALASLIAIAYLSAGHYVIEISTQSSKIHSLKVSNFSFKAGKEFLEAINAKLFR